MKKIINSAETVIDELIDGFVAAHNRYYRKHEEVNGIIYKQNRTAKVALVIGGGSGHEPMFAGFAGRGLADAAACGNVFASPDPNTIYETAKAVEDGAGVLFVYGCYAGDNLNFDMAEEFLDDEGIKTAHVRVWDDVVSAPKERIEDRRGIAGDVFVIKIAGAACDEGYSLEKVKQITEAARDNTFSIGIATSSGQLPGVDRPIFELEDDEIEYGMGLHGEPGIKRTKMASADQLTETLYNNLMKEAKIKKDEEVCVLINSLGATSLLELSIIYKKVQELLNRDQIKIHDSDLNVYCTSQGMGGFSITVIRLNEELKKLYNKPCFSPYYAKEEIN